MTRYRLNDVLGPGLLAVAGTGASPDTCEIGPTWLSRNAIRTVANTKMKRLTLTHTFETWRVRSVCLHASVTVRGSPPEARSGLRRAEATPRYEPFERLSPLVFPGMPQPVLIRVQMHEHRHPPLFVRGAVFEQAAQR